MTVLVLDSEAVTALITASHRKHRAVVGHLEAVHLRRSRRGGDDVVVVPVTARVEAGWDRSAARAGGINRFPVDDAPLDAPTADRAASIRSRTRTSVVDAHVGAVVGALPGDAAVVVLTSDPRDMTAVCAPRRIRTQVV